MLKDIFLRLRNAFSSSQNASSLSEWFLVQFDDNTIQLKVNPPSKESWEAQIEWKRITRVCFNAGDLYTGDDIDIFTDERPESFLIPTEANGGDALWEEIIRRKLFDAEKAIEAVSSTNKLVCCPPIE